MNFLVFFWCSLDQYLPPPKRFRFVTALVFREYIRTDTHTQFENIGGDVFCVLDITFGNDFGVNTLNISIEIVMWLFWCKTQRYYLWVAWHLIHCLIDNITSLRHELKALDVENLYFTLHIHRPTAYS